MIELALAALLATAEPAAGAPAEAATTPDTTLRVPGTVLRFGMTLPMVHRHIRTGPSTAPAPPDGAIREAKMRCFGLDSDATLTFVSGSLAHAAFLLHDPSPHDIDYVEDDLARQGFQRRCAQRQGLDRRCTWMGAIVVEFVSSATMVSLDMQPPTPAPRTAPQSPVPPPAPAAAAPAVAAPVVARPAVAPESPAPAALETLWIAATGVPDSVVAPRVIDSCRAVRPEAARRAGLFGRVGVEVLVDTSGAVIDARIKRSIPALDPTALECARRYRFVPAQRHGRPVRAWVPLSIRFVL